MARRVSMRELAWYGLLRLIRRWASDLPEAAAVDRSVRASDRVAAALGLPRESLRAMCRGLAQAFHCRMRGVSVLEKFEPAGLRRWEAFRREAVRHPKAVFVGAHLGPFELQMDLMADLPHQILFLYRSYRWPPLADLVDSLRLRADNLKYLEYRQSLEIARSLGTGRSLAVLADQAPASRALPIFGRPALDEYPIRFARRSQIPVFVGGLFNSRNNPGLFGFDCHAIFPGRAADLTFEYRTAFEKTIRNNPEDWVHLA